VSSGKLAFYETDSGSMVLACFRDPYVLLHFDRICGEVSSRSI